MRLAAIALALVAATAAADSSPPKNKVPADAPLRIEGEQVHLLIHKDGRISVGDRAVTEAELEKALIARRDNPPSVRIGADGDVVYRRVIAVIDLVKRNGVSKFALDVAPEK
jgi:biopolymer transport protein ExbD